MANGKPDPKFVAQFNAVRRAAAQNPAISAPDEYVSVVSNAGKPVYNASDVDRLAMLRERNRIRIGDLTDLSKRFLPDYPIARTVPFSSPQPSPRTVADFNAAVSSVRARQNMFGATPSKSKLSPDQLMANAAAYNARKQAESQARHERRMLGQQVRNYKDMAGLGYNDPVVVRPGVDPEAMLAADMNRQRMGMQERYMNRDFGLRERALDQESEAANLADRLARLRHADEVDFRTKQLGLDKQRLGIEEGNASDEAKYRADQLKALAARFEWDKEKYKDAETKAKDEATYAYLPPSLAGLVRSGRMTREQAMDIVENEIIRDQSGGDEQRIVEIMRERGYSPEEIARKFELIAGKTKKQYDDAWTNNVGPLSIFDYWMLKNVPEVNPSNLPPGYVPAQ